MQHTLRAGAGGGWTTVGSRNWDRASSQYRLAQNYDYSAEMDALDSAPAPWEKDAAPEQPNKVQPNQKARPAAPAAPTTKAARKKKAPTLSITQDLRSAARLAGISRAEMRRRRTRALELGWSIEAILKGHAFDPKGSVKPAPTPRPGEAPSATARPNVTRAENVGDCPHGLVQSGCTQCRMVPKVLIKRSGTHLHLDPLCSSLDRGGSALETIPADHPRARDRAVCAHCESNDPALAASVRNAIRAGLVASARAQPKKRRGASGKRPPAARSTPTSSLKAMRAAASASGMSLQEYVLSQESKPPPITSSGRSQKRKA